MKILEDAGAGAPPVVVRRLKPLVLAASLMALAAVVLLALTLQPQVIDAKLLAVHGFPDTTADKQDYGYACIELRLTRKDAPYLELADEQVVQFKVAGKWLAREKLDRHRLETTMPYPGCGQVAVVPNRRGAEAFRLELTYRRQSPRDELMLSLMDRGSPAQRSVQAGA
jgi:hypothetical protein